MISFDATLPSSERLETVGTQLQFRHDQRSYDSWRQVFERACATQRDESEQRATVPDAPSSAQTPSDDMPARHSAEETPENTSARAAFARASTGVHQSSTSQEAAANTQTHVAGKSNSETRLYGQASIANEPTVADPEQMPIPDRPATARPCSANPDDAAHERFHDSVTVVVEQRGVSIVVRDAFLQERAAIEAAFEVASDVSAGRSALRQLVLNGRTLYCRGEESPPGREPIFIC